MKEKAAAGCPHSHQCGSCKYSSVPYETQIEEKHKYLEKLFGKYCGKDVRIEPVIASKSPLNYRMKIHMACGLKAGKAVFGGFKSGTHEIVSTEGCMIEDEQAAKIASDTLRLAAKQGIDFYDEDRRRGYLRHVIVRKGAKTGQIMVIIVTSGKIFPGSNNLVKAMLSEHPEITTVVQNIYPGCTSAIMGNVNKVLYGKGHIDDELDGFRFRISPGSFYQVNPAQAEKLYRLAIKYASLSPDDFVIDAYCGTGTIGILASPHAGKVLGIESVSSAIKDAKFNASLNVRANISFVCADATEFLCENASSLKPNVIFMDPPRSGSTPDFIRAASYSGADRIVYVSCNPQTLARDLGIFAACGFRPGSIGAVDMFPYTDHVETVCLLSNRKADAKIKIDVDLEDYYAIKDARKSQN